MQNKKRKQGGAIPGEEKCEKLGGAGTRRERGGCEKNEETKKGGRGPGGQGQEGKGQEGPEYKTKKSDEDRTCNKLDYLCNARGIVFRKKSGDGFIFYICLGENLINHINH